MNVWSQHCDSVQEFCATEPSKLNADKWAVYVSRYENDRWLYGDAGSIDGIKARVRDGWEKGADRLLKLNAGELKAPVSIKRALVRADQGDELDIHSVYRGELGRAWTRRSRSARRAPAIVRIVPIIAGSANLESDQFFYRGAAVVRLADALTAAGYNVEIVAAVVAQTIGIKYAKPDFAHTLTIKPSTAPLDVSNLAAVLCQQGFVRYFMFKAMYSYTKEIGTHCGTYSDAKRLNDLARIALGEAASTAPTVFMQYQIGTKDAAEQWIADSIAQIEGGALQQAA